MLTVNHYARIRQLHREGHSLRQIARQLGHSPKTILKALRHPEPIPNPRPVPRAAPTFDPIRPLVDAILAADEHAPRKQRHTASQIYRRLVAEYGYTGSYGPIQRYLKERRLDRRDTFVPLDHRPGHRCEADFGHIHVDFPDGRRLVPVLVLTWSYSNAPFALALPTERTEAVLHGMSEGFTFFGRVPREVWWDNPTTVAIHVGRGRDRTPSGGGPTFSVRRYLPTIGPAMPPEWDAIRGLNDVVMVDSTATVWPGGSFPKGTSGAAWVVEGQLATVQVAGQAANGYQTGFGQALEAVVDYARHQLFELGLVAPPFSNFRVLNFF